MQVTLEIQCGLGVEQAKPQQKKGKGRMYEMTSVLTVTSDNTFVDYRRIPYVYSQGVTFGQGLIYCRTRSLGDVKTFVVFAELTKPSQSVVAIIGSVRTDLVGFNLVIDSLQETIAGDTVSRSFKPDLPGNEYPTLNTKPLAPSQDSEEYGGPVDQGDSRIRFNSDNLNGTRFSSPSPAPNKPKRSKEPLAGSGKTNLRETNVGTPHGERKPEQLSNGNYR